MQLKINICGLTSEDTKSWVARVQESFSELGQITIYEGLDHLEKGNLLFLDGRLKGLEQLLKRIDRRRQTSVLVVQDGFEVPLPLKNGWVDGAISVPLSKLELMGCIRLFEHTTMWQEVGELNHSLSEALKNISEDFKLAERLQKGLLPKRFPDVKNFKVFSRYLAGCASGGDYFDLAEAKDGKSISLILSNASSYGLTSSVLTILLKVTFRLSQEIQGSMASPSHVVQGIYKELELILGEKDRLSLFYGTLSRSDLILRYVHLGQASAYLAQPKQGFSVLPKQVEFIQKNGPPADWSEKQVQLRPDSRLVLVSGGLEESCGGFTVVEPILQNLRNLESVDTLNELFFQAKKSVSEDIGMPNRDCSAVILEAESLTLRAIKPEQDES